MVSKEIRINSTWRYKGNKKKTTLLKTTKRDLIALDLTCDIALNRAS